MIALLYFILGALVSPFKAKCRLEAENAALRYQLIVLRRKVRGRIRLTNGDRLVFIQLYRWFPSVLKVITVIRPGDARAFASGRLTPLLALEIALVWRAAADQRGATCADPANEHREPAEGSAAYPRRTA